MRSKIAQRIQDNTPQDLKIFVRMYAAIVVRVHELIEVKGITKKELAEGMGKNPSEISKWLNGQHNFTLRSIAKLEAELGQPILQVPSKFTFNQKLKLVKFSHSKRDGFIKGTAQKTKSQTRIA